MSLRTLRCPSWHGRDLAERLGRHSLPTLALLSKDLRAAPAKRTKELDTKALTANQIPINYSSRFSLVRSRRDPDKISFSPHVTKSSMTLLKKLLDWPEHR
jgi:hypothetical protein